MATTDTAARRMAEQAAASPAKTIYRFLDRGETEVAALTYAEMDDRARRIAAALLDLGLGGEPLLLVFEPGEGFAAALAGCLYAGVVAVPAPAPRPGASLERLEGIAAGTRCRFMLASAAVEAAIGAELGPDSPLRALTMLALETLDTGRRAETCPGFDLQDDAPVLIQYTSGSTRTPRGVVLGSAGVAANLDLATRGIGFGAEGPETFVNWMPHYHDMGLVGNLILPLAMGHPSIHMPPMAFVQQPARWLQAISRYRGTASGGPPLAFDSCVARIPEEVLDTLDLSSWRIGFCGAEPVFRSTLEAFRDRFARCGLPPKTVFCVYGLAEVAVYAAGSPPPDAPPASQGAAERAPCFLDAECRDTLRIVSEAGAPLPEGEEGEIWIGGPCLASGYLGDPEASAATFRNRLKPDDGRLYLRTGDLGSIAGDALTITGRIKDVLIRNGGNVAASDVERIAAEGRPPLNPNAAAAFQCDGPASPIVLLLEKPRGPWEERLEPELVRQVRGSVADGLGLALDEVCFVEAGALPRTTSGKIQRARARAGWLRAQPGAGA